MDIPSRPLLLYVMIAREVDGQVGMPAGPPCFGKQAEACAANPSRPSQYKLIPAEICEKFGLPPGSCVCKSKDCWRVFGMAEPKKPPGRPSAAVKLAREECLTPVFSVSTSSRSKTLEYAVHCKFRMREGGAAFPDTFWLSPRELKHGGCSMAEIETARNTYEEAVAMAGEEACCDLSSEESEDERSDGSGGEGELGEVNAGAVAEAVAEAEAEAEPVHVPGAAWHGVPLPPPLELCVVCCWHLCSSRMSADIHGYPGINNVWISMDNPWICLCVTMYNIHGYPCILCVNTSPWCVNTSP